MIEDIPAHIDALRNKADEYNLRADQLEEGQAIAVSYYDPKTELHTVTCLQCEGVHSTVKSELDIPLALHTACESCNLTPEQKADKCYA